MGRFGVSGGQGVLTGSYSAYWLSTTYQFGYTGNAYTFGLIKTGATNFIDIKAESMSQNALPVFNAQ